MKIIQLLFLLLTGAAGFTQDRHPVISQVYGGGGNSGAPFTHDFIELFNPTAEPVKLDGMTVQYSGASTASWSSNRVVLAGTIAPGHYFLIQLASGGSNGVALPVPDLASTALSLSSGSGKIALVSNSTALSGNCPTMAVVDFVGYGTADCYETAAGPSASNGSSLVRNNNGCSDLDNNATDFKASVPDPRNSKAHPHSCSGTLSIQKVETVPFCIDDGKGAAGTVAFSTQGVFDRTTCDVVLSTAQGSFVSPIKIGSTVITGTDPEGVAAIEIPAGMVSGMQYRIRLQTENPDLTGVPAVLEIINPTTNAASFSAVPHTGQLLLQWTNPSGCFDEIMIVVKEQSAISGIPSGDGSAYWADNNFSGTGSAFDGGKVVYKGTMPGQWVTGLVNGTKYHITAFSRRGRYWSAGISTEAVPRILPEQGEVVINQVSPDYNAAGDEYIEIVNLGGRTFDLSDLSLRFTNTDGRNVVAGGTLSGTLLPHSYWLLSPNDTVTIGKTKDMITDQVIDGGFAAQNQQLALLRKTDNLILDAVAYGTINVPVYVEGTPAANPPANGGLRRVVEGRDQQNNNQDFTRVNQGDISLHNSRSRLANKGAMIAGGKYEFVEVTGNATIAGAVMAVQLDLEEGTLSLGHFNLSVDSTEGGTATSYIRTNGTGMLTVHRVDSILVPVGNSTYNPVTITNRQGHNWSVRVSDELKMPAPFTGTTAVLRSWEIYPSAAVSESSTLRFEYDDQHHTGSGFSKTAPLEVWIFQNEWRVAAPPQYPITTNSGRKSVVVRDSRQFSIFSVANVQVPLSIRFSSFTAIPFGDHIRLSFVNESESDVKHYIWERSFNGKDFHALQITAPSANNYSRAAYQLTDWQPFAGYNFYRLKGTELSGKTFYSHAIKINTIKTTRMLSVVPNPVQGNILHWEATLPKGSYKVMVLNSSGLLVYSDDFQHAGGNAYRTLALPPGLTPGVYILQLRNNEKQLQKLFLME